MSIKGPEKPDGILDLIYLMWMSLSWPKAGQAAFLVFAVGLALSMFICVLAYVVVGVSPLWSVGGLLAAGGRLPGYTATWGAAVALRRLGNDARPEIGALHKQEWRRARAG
jgi:hypothetical protein